MNLKKLMILALVGLLVVPSMANAIGKDKTKPSYKQRMLDRFIWGAMEGLTSYDGSLSNPNIASRAVDIARETMTVRDANLIPSIPAISPIDVSVNYEGSGLRVNSTDTATFNFRVWNTRNQTALEGVTIYVHTSAGGLSTREVMSDEDGNAAITLTAPNSPGIVKLQADVTISGEQSTVKFTVPIVTWYQRS